MYKGRGKMKKRANSFQISALSEYADVSKLVEVGRASK